VSPTSWFSIVGHFVQTSVTAYEATRRHNPEVKNLNNSRCGNLETNSPRSLYSVGIRSQCCLQNFSREIIWKTSATG
jgi:hypothetical protein